MVTRVAGDGEVVRVVEGGRGWGYGPGPGFLLFPLLGIGVVALLVTRGRRGGYGGWCGPGPAGPWAPQARMEEWHRRAHEDARSGESAAPTSPAG